MTTFDVTADFSGMELFVPWESKIFECGLYPAQEVDARETSYLDTLVANFRKVRFKNGHREDRQSILTGLDLGGCDRIWRKGTELWGAGRVHQAIRSLVGVPKASVEIENRDTNPTLSAIALLNFPQVSDAQVVAAFEAFNDLAGVGSPAAANAATHCPNYRPSADASAKEKRMTLKEKFLALFGKSDAAALKEAGFTSEEMVQLNALDPDVDAMIADSQARKLDARAAAFAQSFSRAEDVAKRKILPAGEPAAIDMYKMAVLADGNGAACFSADGEVIEGANVAKVRAHFESLPALPYFGQSIPDQLGRPHDDLGANPADHADTLLSFSETGRAALRKRGAKPAQFSAEEVTKIGIAVATALNGGK